MIAKAAALVSAVFFLSVQAWAANTGELPCKTTAECNAQAEKIGATVAPAAGRKADAGED